MGPPTNTVDPWTYCGKVHPVGCVLKSHPDANQNTVIPWKDSPTKAIIRLKGADATLEIQNRCDPITQWVVPLDHDNLTNLRKHLPPGKSYGKNLQGESVMLLSVNAGTPFSVGLQTVDKSIVRPCNDDLTTDQVLIPTIQSGDGQPTLATPSSGRPPCCGGHDGSTSGHLIPATLRLRNNAPLINVLIAGCLQTSIISAKIAALLLILSYSEGWLPNIRHQHCPHGSRRTVVQFPGNYELNNYIYGEEEVMCHLLW